MFWTITFDFVFHPNPPPVIRASVPKPTIVLFPRADNSPETVIVPFTRIIVAELVPSTASFNSAALLTVTTGPPSPPVTPPLSEANPSGYPITWVNCCA